MCYINAVETELHSQPYIQLLTEIPVTHKQNMCLDAKELKSPCLNNIWTSNRIESLNDKNRELSNSLSIIFSQNSMKR